MKHRLATWTAILACVGIVIWPFVSGASLFSPVHWHLAAAANSLEFNDGRFDEHMAKARLANGNLESIYDYWLLRVRSCFFSVDGELELPDVIRGAKESGISPWLVNTLASSAASRLQAQSKYMLAASVIEVVTKESRTSPVVRNELAYMRALAGDELDVALEDIELALEQEPDNDAYRDTRAWVLFQMGRPLEALEDADFAVSHAMSRRDPTTTAFNALVKATNEVLFGEDSENGDSGDSLAEKDESDYVVGAEDQDAESKQVLAQSEVSLQIWNEAVLRYHRLRILESLGREEEAEVDRAWIRSMDLPVDDRLR
ncbi:MAG: hypothetical protein ACE361_11125 [Aureliella sp.]